MIDDMQVYIANLGKYNEGELVGDWFSFPLDEEVIAERIGLNAEYEEYAIHDTDNFPMEISEYTSIEELVEHKDDIILFADLPPLFRIEGAFLKYFGIPVALTWFTQNPTLAPAVQKSKYEPKTQEADVSISSDTVKDATAFLETFFKLYPTATEKELAYYVKDGVLAPVSGDYVFSELENPVFTKDGDNFKVSVSVKYLDNKSKMTQISQYELVLHKDDNWKIVG